MDAEEKLREHYVLILLIKFTNIFIFYIKYLLNNTNTK